MRHCRDCRPGHVCDVHRAKRAVGDFVKARDGACRICGTTQGLDWAHLIPQGRAPSLRFDPRNAVALCREHHRWIDEHPRDRDRLAELWVGEQTWSELKLLALEGGRVDLDAILAEFAAGREMRG
jgi:hypothetical protein